MGSIHFFSENIKFKLPHPRKTSHWIKECIKKERRELLELTYIFCSDAYLHAINLQYLNHDTLTDIVTFDNSESDELEGDIYISIERIRENAEKFQTDFDSELHRVIIHGALHLMGYKDKKSEDKKLMRKKEDTYLSLRK